MATAAYNAWVRAGRPYRLCRPAAALQRNLRRRGIVVYDYPDDSHLEARIPEDHTPFSATEWPIQVGAYVGRADDIMPRSSSYAHRKENADIARRLIRDRDAGHPGVRWIKYLNWTDENGVCRQERWMDPANPNKRTTRSSSDKGHIHVSGRSDMDNYAGADDYDPLDGGSMSLTADQDRKLDNADRYGWNGWNGSDPIQVTGGNGQPVTVPNMVIRTLKEILAVVKVIAEKVDIGPDELAAIEQAARQGATAALANPEALDALAQELSRVSDKETIKIALSEFFGVAVEAAAEDDTT